MPAKILEGQNPVRRELAKEETSAVEGAGGAWRKNAASSMGIPLHTVMTDDRSKNLFQYLLKSTHIMKSSNLAISYPVDTGLFFNSFFYIAWVYWKNIII